MAGNVKLKYKPRGTGQTGASKSGWKPVVGSENQYSVAYRTKIPSTSYPGRSRGHHFQEANKSLLKQMDDNPQFAQAMENLIPDIRNQLVGPKGGISRNPPSDWTWHHHTDTGVMELVPTVQHTAPGNLQQILHPGGQGGMATWGK